MTVLLRLRLRLRPRLRPRLRRRLAYLVILAAITVSGGCDLFDKIKSPTSPDSPVTVAPPAPTAAIRYTAIGASDANGVGASVPCIPFSGCETGTGYVPLLARRLRTSHEVTLTNLGIPEAVLSPAIQAVAKANGRDVIANFVDREVPFVPTNSTVVTVLGGPNDALALVDAIEKGAAGTTTPRAYIDNQIAAFGADYDKLIKGVQERAPQAYIILLNMPNLAGLPFAANYAQPRRQLLQAASVGFSREANRRAGSGVVVVDLMCDATVYDRTRFSSDGFHPNDAGYAYVTDKLVPAVNGSSPTPPASCSLMTIVPPL